MTDDLFGGAGAQQRRLMIPRPPGRGGFARRVNAKPVPMLGEAKHPDAVYVLDSGVGFAFSHVDELDILAQHYAGRLAYTDVVAGEWARHANRAHLPGVAGETTADREARELDNALRVAGVRLVADAEELFGEPVGIALHQQPSLDALHAELVNIQGPGADDGRKHMGEVHSVRHGELLMADGVEVVVLCANDQGARQLAKNHGLACRTMRTVLTEMVHSETIELTQTDADALFKRMSEVTRLPAAEQH